jgi:hypothetical protein
VPQDREGIRDLLHEPVRSLPAKREGAYLGAYGGVPRGVSTRKVREVTEELCGTSFSKSTLSRLATALDSELE